VQLISDLQIKWIWSRSSPQTLFSNTRTFYAHTNTWPIQAHKIYCQNYVCWKIPFEEWHL